MNIINLTYFFSMILSSCFVWAAASNTTPIKPNTLDPNLAIPYKKNLVTIPDECQGSDSEKSTETLVKKIIENDSGAK